MTDDDDGYFAEETVVARRELLDAHADLEPARAFFGTDRYVHALKRAQRVEERYFTLIRHQATWPL